MCRLDLLLGGRQSCGMQPQSASEEILPGVVLDGDRALYLRGSGTLIVSDVHWGYSESHRHSGNLLPLLGDEEIGATLDRLLHRHAARHLVFLGDTLHTPRASDAAERWLNDANRRLPGLHVSLISGNHDRAWGPARVAFLEIDGWLLHHGDQPQDGAPSGRGEIIGHWHPSFSYTDGAGTRLKVPALVQGERRLILPAFSPWAGGVAWQDRLRPDERLWLVSRRRVFVLPRDPGQPNRPVM